MVNQEIKRSDVEHQFINRSFEFVGGMVARDNRQPPD
jgi:hypothetical protein